MVSDNDILKGTYMNRKTKNYKRIETVGIIRNHNRCSYKQIQKNCGKNRRGRFNTIFLRNLTVCSEQRHQ